MSEDLLQRAYILLNQGRFDEAEKYLGQLIAKDPNNSMVLAMLCQVKLKQEEHEEAIKHIDDAIAASPDTAYLYGIKAEILLVRKEYDEAEELLQHATRINPEDAHAFALWSLVKLSRKDFSAALELANHALELDPDEILALNNRSTAQLKLKRAEESFNTIEDALEKEPDNSYTHSNYGWNLLEKQEVPRALDHFAEALRLDPNNEYAQAGMAEALKARHPLYRLFLRYQFFMDNLMAKYQWGVIIGFYMLFKALQRLARSNEALGWLLTPVLVLMTIFAFSTWIFTPISNVFLRFNRYGKHLLSPRQKISSTAVAVMLLCSVISVAAYFYSGSTVLLSIAAVTFTMMIPLSVMFMPAKNKYFMQIYAGVMGLLGIAAIVQTMSSGAFFGLAMFAYMIGLFAIQFIANYISIGRP